MARPRLFCVLAQSSGTRSRGSQPGRVRQAAGCGGRPRADTPASAVLRYPGHLLAPGEFVPPAVVDFIGRQLDLDPRSPW